MEEKNKYTAEELQEFEVLINEKLDKAKNQLNFIKESISKTAGAGSTYGNIKTLEDGAETAEKESLNQLAARQQKFINNVR